MEDAGEALKETGSTPSRFESREAKSGWKNGPNKLAEPGRSLCFCALPKQQDPMVCTSNGHRSTGIRITAFYAGGIIADVIIIWLWW